jgi:TRAP-type C4-dicarboxylate transport system substrate-binding protein
MGFNVIPVATNDTLISLNSGIVDATFQSPIAIGATQVFGIANNMTDLSLAPFLGGLVITQRAWREIQRAVSPDVLQQMQDAAAQIQGELNQAVEQLESTAVDQMKGYGLNVVELTQAQKNDWYALVGGNALVDNKTFDSDFYNRVSAALNAYRAGNQ